MARGCTSPFDGQSARVSLRGRVLRLVACLALTVGPPALGQQSAALAAEQSRGSFGLTVAGATAGALVGFGMAALVAPSGGGLCPTEPGARCGNGSGAVLAVASATVLGAGSGAVLARRLSGGRQSAVRSLVGAGLGLMVGAAILTELDTDAAVPVVLSITVPQGLFAALVGW